MPKKILVVDDERQIVKLIEINLRKAGYDVVCAYDGVEGEEKAKSERPDMIIIDQRLRRQSGFDLTKALHEEPTTQEIPLIMHLAAESGDADLFAAWQLDGVHNVLQKPFNPREMLTSIGRIFEAIDEEKEGDETEDGA